MPQPLPGSGLLSQGKARLMNPKPKIRRLLVTRRANAPAKGHLIIAGRAIPCALGRSGISRSKREGDGATPAGRFKLLGGFYRADRLLRPNPKLQAIQPRFGWCDGAQSRTYNRPIHLPSAEPHELLWRQDQLYDLVVVLNYNIAPVRRGRGSAIFFHLCDQDYSPTAGCVAITRKHMRHLLPRLAKTCVMLVR